MDPMGALATITQTMYADDGHALELQYPRSMPEQIVRDRLVPAVEGGIRSLAWMASSVHRAVVTAYLEDRIQIAYLTWNARVLHQDVIPVIAAAGAIQAGRNRLDAMMLDRDLYDAAQSRLNKNAMRRLDFS